MKKLLRAFCVAAVLVTMSGCGDHDDGANDNGTQVSDGYVFPAGKATLVFSVVSSEPLDSPVSGIDLAVTLPHGMSVTTDSGASGMIAASAITPGSKFTGTNLSFGTYSASSGKIRLNMATASNSYRSGELFRLTCAVGPDTQISLTDVKALNSPVLILKAVGYDAAAGTTVLLNNRLRVTIGAIN